MFTPHRSPSRRGIATAAWLAAFIGGAAGISLAFQPVPTTRNDFLTPGSQPGQLTDPLVSPSTCAFCHSDYAEDQAPFNRWAASMMGQSARDPIWRAAVAIANQDANQAGLLCLRCHTPTAFMAGHTNPPDPSTLSGEDANGVACSVCHRMVDPQNAPGAPSVDASILAGISPFPTEPNNASYVLDPLDRRRGPFDLNADWASTPFMGWPGYHEFLKSPFHQSSRLCASCHEVSLPHFTRQADGTYAVNPMDTPGPAKDLQKPEQRTYSEWVNSLFALGPVDLGGRFGGTRGAVSSCQDCHMPGIAGQGCALDPPVRPKLPQHNFNGANSWVIRAVRSLYFDSETGLSQQSVDDSIARNVAMLAAASDMQLSRVGANLNVRITNFTGHKLPTGYPEGRRMWINVKFKNAQGQVIQEHGAYSDATNTLDAASTKVYEQRGAISADVAAVTGKPAGESFHLVLNNVLIKDNRIPPMGYHRAAFENAQAGHVPADLYADGQYWDDTAFVIPSGARTAEVNVYHQTTTREYIEFLLSENTTNDAGQTAYDAWDLIGGRSAPVLMDSGSLPLSCPCDWNQSGLVSVQDIFDFLASYFNNQGDFNNSGATTVQDIFDFLACYFGGCA